MSALHSSSTDGASGAAVGAAVGVATEAAASQATEATSGAIAAPATEAEFLAGYHAEDYPRPSLTVDIVLFALAALEQPNFRKLPEQHLQVLLIRRGAHPYRGAWALPGGFLSPDETLEQAARRELFEETAAEVAYLEQLYTFSELDRDPRDWVISAAYLALANKANLLLQAGSDAADADWFTARLSTDEQGVAHLTLSSTTETLTATLVSCESSVRADTQRAATPPRIPRPLTAVESDLAFDHASIIAYAIERLRNKVEYTDVALELLPELFTLTELQQAHEQILGYELLTPAFRRRIASSVVATECSKTDAGHRPSRLYKRK